MGLIPTIWATIRSRGRPRSLLCPRCKDASGKEIRPGWFECRCGCVFKEDD